MGNGYKMNNRCSSCLFFRDWISNYWLFAISLTAIVTIVILASIGHSFIILSAAGAIIIITAIAYRRDLYLLSLNATRLERFKAYALYDEIEKISYEIGIPCPHVRVMISDDIDVFSISTSINKNHMIITSKAIEALDEKDMEMVLKAELTKKTDKYGLLKTISKRMLYMIFWSRDLILATLLKSKNINIEESIVGDGISIRALTGKDLIDIFRLQYMAFKADAQTLHELQKMIGNTSLTYIALKDGKIIGFLTGRIKLDRSGLYGRGDSLVIDDSYRRHGLGKYLMISLSKTFKKAGCRNVIAEIMIDNTKSINLFESIGYKKAGIIKDFYGKGSDALFMVLDLVNE